MCCDVSGRLATLLRAEETSFACCPWFALQVAVCVSGFLLYSAVLRPAVVAIQREGGAVVLWLCAFVFAGFCSVVWWVSAAVVVAPAHTNPSRPRMCDVFPKSISHTCQGLLVRLPVTCKPTNNTHIFPRGLCLCARARERHRLHIFLLLVPV